MKIARTVRVLRAFLIGAGLLGTVYALFIAIEDWRGDRALARERARVAAEGESLDPAAYSLPAVPAERNFMASPFLRMLAEGGPKNGPTYIEMMQRWAHDEVRQRWTTFTKRLDQLVVPNGSWASSRREEFQIRPWPPPDRGLWATKNLNPQETLAVFDPIESDIKEVRERARNCAISQYEQDRYPESVQLAPLFTFSKAIELHGLAELRLGRGGEAFSDAVVLMRMAQAGAAGPTLLERLVGRAICGELTQIFWEGWADGAWSDEDLKSYHDFYASLDPWNDLIKGISYTRARMVTELLSQEWGVLDGNYGAARRGHWFLLPRGWISQNAAAASRGFDSIISQYDISERRFHPLREDLGAQKPAIVNPFNWLLQFSSFPMLGRVFREAADRAPDADAGAMVASLELFRRETGRYPATLDELTPKFLPAVPHSVITGMRPDYARVDAGHFRLSSAGWSEGAKPPAWVWRAPVPTND
jgi:hypothetical protein